MNAPRLTPASVPVVIVGAGPTGVTAATLLARRGIECLVLDRWEDVYPQPRAVHLDDEIFRILAHIGIRDQFAAISRPALGLRLLDPNMKVMAEFRRHPNKSPHGYPQANMFDQPELEALLRDNLARHTAATIRGNVEVTDLAPTDGGHVRVSFTDRTSGCEHVVEARYVLGCDGANSLTRAVIGGGMEDLGFEQRWLVIDIDTDAELNQWDGVHQLCSPVRAGTYMRISDTRYRWEFQLHDNETAADYQTLDDVVALIKPWVADPLIERLTLVRVCEYTFRAKVANRWRHGNLFILGDAAHLTPPFIGQGLCAGLRDAMNLSWKLCGVLDNSLPDTVLDTYEQERKPHARAMIRLAVAVGWAMTAGGDFGNLFRRLLVPWLLHVPGMRAKVVYGITPPLRRSALVIASFGRGQVAGTLCPNAIIGNGSRLDDLAGGRFVLVTSTAPTRRQQEKLDGCGITVVVTRPEDELGRWLRNGRARVALVRPDRTVMQVGRRLDPLCDRATTLVPVASLAH